MSCDCKTKKKKVWSKNVKGNVWNQHVKSTWEKNKSKKGYKFGDALKDASKSWKGCGK